MKCFSYIIARDYGFAPNPFGLYCTLATCKPDIRNQAVIGDLIVGTGSVKYNAKNKLVYAMYVDDKITFDEYWKDKKYEYKKPILNGSLKQMYGDNIYHFSSKRNVWLQANSHHSKPDGSTNMYNLKRDLKSKNVLISQHFWYFGKIAPTIPSKLNDICIKGRGYKSSFTPDLINEFIKWLNNYSMGYKGDPNQFDLFRRYNGVS